MQVIFGVLNGVLVHLLADGVVGLAPEGTQADPGVVQKQMLPQLILIDATPAG